jgi:hypothetical protein
MRQHTDLWHAVHQTQVPTHRWSAAWSSGGRDELRLVPSPTCPIFNRRIFRFRPALTALTVSAPVSTAQWAGSARFRAAEVQFARCFGDGHRAHRCPAVARTRQSIAPGTTCAVTAGT